MTHSGDSQDAPRTFQRHWNFYRTEHGKKVVKEYLLALPATDRAAIVAEMEAVRVEGLEAARHVRGEIYEVRVTTQDLIYRVFFATEGRFSHILLALEAFSKKTPKAPPGKIDLAERRLAEWRARSKRD